MLGIEGVLARANGLVAGSGMAQIREAALDGRNFFGVVDQVATVADEGLASARSISDEIDVASAALAKRADELRSSGKVDVLDGVELLDMTDADRAIGALRERNPAFDVMPEVFDRVEGAIRSVDAVNAEVAGLLGFPIASAHIPVGGVLAKGAGLEFVNSRLYATGFVDDANRGAAGYSSVADAQAAAVDFVGKNPGYSVVGIEDAAGGVHLLTTEVNTSPRTIVGHYGFKGRKKLKWTEQVSISAYDDRVRFVTRSDNTVVAADRICNTVLPEGLTRPFTIGEMRDRGLTRVHRSELAITENAIGQISDAANSISKYVTDVGALQTQLMGLQRLRHSIASVHSRPGAGNPSSWAVEPLLTAEIGSEREYALFSENLKGVFVPLPDMDVPEAITFAALKKRPVEGQVTLVLQDSAGMPHLTTANDLQIPGVATKKGKDVRAIVYPKQMVSINQADGSWLLADYAVLHEPSMVAGAGRHSIEGSSARFAPSVLDYQFTIFFMNKSLNQRLFGGGFEFKKFSSHESIRALPVGSPLQVVEKAIEVVRSPDGRNKPMAIISILGRSATDAANLSAQQQEFGLVALSAVPDGTNMPRDYRYSAGLNQNVLAIVDQTGLVYMRPLE